MQRCASPFSFLLELWLGLQLACSHNAHHHLLQVTAGRQRAPEGLPGQGSAAATATAQAVLGTSSWPRAGCAYTFVQQCQLQQLREVELWAGHLRQAVPDPADVLRLQITSVS